jgi:hypothetical protein
MNFSAFYGTRRFITAFTRTLPCPYSEPAQSTPCLPSHFLKIRFNVILPSTPGSSKWSLSLVSFRPLGWYRITDLSCRYVVFLISRSNQFLWCVFKRLLCYWFSVCFECLEFLWPSGILSRNSGIKNLICAASILCASLLFVIQLRYHENCFPSDVSAVEILTYISFTEILDLTLSDRFGVLYDWTLSFGYHHYIVGIQHDITSTPATWWPIQWVSSLYLGWFWKISQYLRFLTHNLTPSLTL